MNALQLREQALLLESSISEEKGHSKDVAFLASYEPLLAAIGDAKAGRILSPREMSGLSRWLFESNIRDFPVLSDRLSGFLILLRGWDLPRLAASGLRQESPDRNSEGDQA